jgi:hypothetical protein
MRSKYRKMKSFISGDVHTRAKRRLCQAVTKPNWVTNAVELREALEGVLREFLQSTTVDVYGLNY